MLNKKKINPYMSEISDMKKKRQGWQYDTKLENVMSAKGIFIRELHEQG